MNPTTPPSPIRVLLVEDSEHDRLAFQRALEKSTVPTELTICDRAEDIPALLKPGTDRFDIVVVDQNLPGTNGLAAYRDLQKQGDLPPFVMLTGTGSEGLAVDALKAGMYDYIIKDPNRGYLQLLPLKLEEVRRRHKDRLAKQAAQDQLKTAHDELDRQVKKRTAQLRQTIESLELQIIERVKTEEALRRSEQALRNLSYKIIETQENERKQMAKELHDSIGSSLAAIKFAVESKLQNMKAAPPGGNFSLEKIVGHLQDTIREVRRISMSLRPSMMDELGLLATMDWYCSACGEVYTKVLIETRWEVDEAAIPDVGKIVIYRVMQEALNNALKHADAKSVRVDLSYVEGCLRMCVSDDGVGFDPKDQMENPDPLSGYGLKSMRDRALVLGGALFLQSAPGKGTSVCLELPCDIDPTGVKSPAA